MKLSSIALIGMCLIAAAGQQQRTASQIPSNLIARWRSLETSKGGIGAMLEFHADGTVDFSPGAVVEAPYRIEGNQLMLPSATTNGPEQKITFKLMGADKVRFEAQDETQGSSNSSKELVRKGAQPAPEHPLIGEWVGTRQMGGRELEYHWLFSSTGKSLFLMPFYTDHGHFAVDGPNIRFELSRTTLPAGHFEVSSDTLILPGNKTQSRYARC